MVKIISVIGTRPEAIKMALLHKLLLDDDNFELKICSTGQHKNLLHAVQNQFDLPIDMEWDAISYNRSMISQASYLIEKLQSYFLDQKPDIVFVHGDTLSAYATAMVAFYNKFTLCHVEAGLRTFNKQGPFPEEIHRRYIDLVADIHFAPTKNAALNLLNEGISQNSIYITGNTGIDAVKYASAYIEKKTIAIDSELEKICRDIYDSNYKIGLLTIHRREISDQKAHEIYKEINDVAERNQLKIIYPIHPNPLFKERYAVLNECKNIIQIQPLDYFSFVILMKMSEIIFSDSGGIQEEATAIGKSVIVLRNETERPEALLSGQNKMLNLKTLHEDTKSILSGEQKVSELYGNGESSRMILKILKTKFL